MIARMAAIIFFILIAGALGQAEAQERLQLGTEGAYPPWNTTTPAGDLVGFDIDLGYALCAEMNVECTFVTQEWDGIIPALNAGRYDAIVSSLSITEERERMIDFSIPYVRIPRVFVARRGSDLLGLGELEDVVQALAGRKIGVQRGTTSSGFVADLVPDAEIVYYNTYDQIVLDLRAGRIDASIGSIVAWQSPQYNPDDMLEAFGPHIDGRMFPEIWGPGRGIGIREGDTALRDRFSSAIRALYERGDIQELSEQWFGGDYSVPPE